MEKATLIVRETKRKKIITELKFAESGKMMPFPELKPEDTGKNGLEVDVEREKGRIVKVAAGDTVLFALDPPAETPQNPDQTTGNPTADEDSPVEKSRLETEHLDHIGDPAYAPYNFIPLNSAVVGVDTQEGEKFPKNLSFDTYFPQSEEGAAEKRNTGWIELDVKTVTPVYIRGLLSEKQGGQGMQSKDTPAFYSPSGRAAIPGSSLRGMARQLVEIVSFGKFGFMDDGRRLYYRAMADRSNLQEEYKRKMNPGGRQAGGTYHASAGVLKKDGLSYFIESSGHDYRQIPRPKAREKVENAGQTYGPFQFFKIEKSGQQASHEYLVVSGPMPNKRHDWVIQPPEKLKKAVVPIPGQDVAHYANDATRSPDVPDLIALLSQGKHGEVPCFYVTDRGGDGQDRVSFGHTAMFRIPYDKAIGEHLPARHRDPSTLDMAEAIFGNETTFPGRVFFEDAELRGGPPEALMPKAYAKTLLSPKPTTFQHYLVQTEDGIKKLNHYNSGSSIRGHKLYWHQSGADRNWRENNPQKTKGKEVSINPEITPVKKGVAFKGRIRFENLTDAELGALWFALDLPEGCGHKIGMGKPLGLGSIRITPRLFLSDRKKRYQDLFSEWNNEGISPDQDHSRFIRAFERKIKGGLGLSDSNSLWETDRLRELRTMLDVQKGNQVEKEGKIRYMELKEFRKRLRLPKPSRVMDTGD